MPTFEEQIAAYIAQHKLLEHTQRYLVALSGGRDSVALLRVLHNLGYALVAAHCNFHLRGAESNRDAAFCKTLCAQWEIPLHVADFDTKTVAQERKVSIEMAAREQRYDYFAHLLTEQKLEAVVVAHHQDDAIETLLLNILRGTGPEGMKGIAPSSGSIRRPLLAVSGEEIAAYLAEKQQEYIVDSSNNIPDIQRNKVRLLIMPQLRRLFPAVDSTLATTMTNMARALPLLHSALAAAQERVFRASDEGGTIGVEQLLREAAPEVVLWEILKRYGYTARQGERIFAALPAETGRQWLSTTHLLTAHRGQLLLTRRRDDDDTPLIIPGEGTFRRDSNTQYRVERITIDETFRPSTAPHTVTVAADKVHFPLTVRRVRAGDRFTPYGMKGTKRVADYLADRHVPRPLRQQQDVVCNADGTIIWLVGHTIANPFALPSPTPTTLRLSLLL